MIVKNEKRTTYNKPILPDVPYGEWRARINKVQKLMKQSGVDCLLLWQKENIRYFSGFQTIHWHLHSLQPAVGIIPTNGEPILAVSASFIGNAEGLSWVNDIRAYGVGCSHKTEAWRQLPIDVADVIKEIGCEKKNIALEMGDIGYLYIPRPLNDIDALRNALPNAKFVNGDEIIWGCRMTKSPLEIERIRKSVDDMAAIQSAIIEGFREGMTEVDVMKIANHTRADQEGAGMGDDISLYVDLRCSARARIIDSGAYEGTIITRDDYIHFNATAAYKGYYPDSCRVWQTGPITEVKKKAYDLLWESEDAAVAVTRPGVKAQELWRAAYRKIKDLKGYLPDSCGHGIGLSGHEPPHLTDWNETILQEGMTLSIEVWMRGIEGWPPLGIQDTLLATANGCEKISGVDREIIQVSHPIL